MIRDGLTGTRQQHEECWELLPWLANERLPGKDFTRIERHLRDCAECQHELEDQRRLRNAIRAEDAVVLAPQASLQKLMQRFEADDRDEVADVGAAASSVEPTTPIPNRLPARRPIWLAAAAAVQGLAIFALLATLWWQSREALTAPRFTTLTSQSPLAQGPVIRVVFAGGVALSEVNQVLRSIDAQIVAGPSEAGVYTLALAAGPESAGTDAALARLRADERILFSEPAMAESRVP